VKRQVFFLWHHRNAMTMLTSVPTPIVAACSSVMFFGFGMVKGASIKNWTRNIRPYHAGDRFKPTYSWQVECPENPSLVHPQTSSPSLKVAEAFSPALTTTPAASQPMTHGHEWTRRPVLCINPSLQYHQLLGFSD
jgi:hypothetical protein